VNIWAWTAIWVTIVLGSLLTFALIARSLFRSAMALGREGATLAEKMNDLSELAETLQKAADEIAARQRSVEPAPYRNLVEVKQSYDAQKRARERARSRRHRF
jgi:biopolymer transport protein ExbB/TolQ